MLSSSYRPNPYCAFSLLFPLPLYKKTVDHNNKMLRRNRFGFRMRRRSLSGRLFQFVVVLTVVSLFIYLLLYTAHFKNDIYGPDFHWLKTRNMSEFVRPQVKTVLREPNHPVCKSEDKLRLLIMVYSSPNNYERRRIIRKTWGKAFANFPGVRMLFLLGQSPTGLESDLETEASKYEDMVQEDFIDTFVNLTLKATFMFKWIKDNDCLSAKFLFKVDDDTFVNPEEMWSSLEHSLLHSATTKSLLPFMKKQDLKQDRNNSPSAATLSESIDYLVMGKLTASVPIRDMSHKLYLPTKFYPLNIFPKHLSGSGYVISMSILPLLYECMLRTPFMNLEDVMLTGLCATTQMGLQLTDNPLFRSKKPPINSDYLCFYKKSAFVHGLSSSEMDDMWIRINEEHNCDTFYFAFVQHMTSFVDVVKNIFRLI